jgi:hypothetical protein
LPQPDAICAARSTKRANSPSFVELVGERRGRRKVEKGQGEEEEGVVPFLDMIGALILYIPARTRALTYTSYAIT